MCGYQYPDILEINKKTRRDNSVSEEHYKSDDNTNNESDNDTIDGESDDDVHIW